VVVPDNPDRGAIYFTVADIAAIAELGREDSQERISIRGSRRFRQPEYFGELGVGKSEGPRPGLGHCGKPVGIGQRSIQADS